VVNADSGEETCWAYQAKPEMIANGLVPSRNYLNHILAGREYLSHQYFDALDQSQTYADDCVCRGRNGEVIFVQESDLLHTLCQSCREARIVWGDALGRLMTIPETGVLMTQLVMQGPGFSSIQELVNEAIARKLILSHPPGE
jgi:hypothetical protein